MFGIANATLIDFESTGLSESATLTTEISGLTFNGAIIVKEGQPLYAFSSYAPGTYDTAYSDQLFDNVFITDLPVGEDTGVSGTIEVSFELPVFDLSFRVADIDIWPGDNKEILTAQAFDVTDTLLETVTIKAGDPGTGDGIATLVEFSVSDISLFTVIVANNDDRAGWGVDNLSYTPIPEPATMLLLGSGLIGLAGARRRFKNK